MLFKKQVLEKIARGEVSIALRRWRKPSVKTGGQLMTPVGELTIDLVTTISPDDITDTMAQVAGYRDRSEALEALTEAPDQLYKIEFRLTAPDWRKTLAERDDLDARTVEAINQNLYDLDVRSRGGTWTAEYLRLVRCNPGSSASHLAKAANVQLAVFKKRMRQIKQLGLIHSLNVGYHLSRRGERYLECVEVPTKEGGEI